MKKDSKTPTHYVLYDNYEDTGFLGIFFKKSDLNAFTKDYAKECDNECDLTVQETTMDLPRDYFTKKRAHFTLIAKKLNREIVNRQFENASIEEAQYDLAVQHLTVIGVKSLH